MVFKLLSNYIQNRGHDFCKNLEFLGPRCKIDKIAKDRSYVEIKAQPLTFSKDMVVYEIVCHIIFQFGDECGKVVGPDWCVQNP